MIFVSHRGNIFGSNPELENNPKYIIEAINQQFDVEIDVWYIDGKYFLGHEAPKYETSIDFLKHESLWCHLKNIEAVTSLSKVKDVHWFWHESDKVTITSKGYVLALVGTVIPGTVVNQPDNSNFLSDNSLYQGILADNIGEFRQKLTDKKHNENARRTLFTVGKPIY